MGKKSKPPPRPRSWNSYKVAAKGVWLGIVEAPDKQAAIEKGAKEFNQDAGRLVCGGAAIDFRPLDLVPSLFLSSAMRGRRDPHDDPAPARPRLLRRLCRRSVNCCINRIGFGCARNTCDHRVAVALVPFIIR
jgi:hypothetical protein